MNSNRLTAFTGGEIPVLVASLMLLKPAFPRTRCDATSVHF